MANVAFRNRVNIILFCFISIICFPQQNVKLKKFSNDFSVYEDELSSFMSASSSSAEKINIKSFFNSISNLSNQEKNKLISISNNMLSKRLRPYPHFTNFFSSMMLINKDQSLLSEWLNVIDRLVVLTTSKKLLLFCAFTENLLSNDVLRSSSNVSWTIDSHNYSFLFEDNNAILSFHKPLILSCSSKGEKYNIYKTSGQYYIFTNQWNGNKGSINWHKHGFNKDTIYAELTNYKLDMRQSKLIADSVVFYNKILFNYPLMGQIVNKITGSTQDEKFPEFNSYSKDIEMKEIFQNIDYKGGYKLKGKEFIADGGDYAKARIIFKRNGKELFVANTNRFVINREKIASQNATIKINFDNDSIFHSNLQFKYIDNKRQLQLYRQKNSSSGSPMLNTYHNITMDFELLEWDIDNNLIKFGSLPGTADSRVRFESVDLYLQEKFESIKGIDAIHPLFLIKNYVDYYGIMKIDLVEFSRYASFPVDQIKRYLIKLSDDGFIFYDFNTDTFTVLSKLYNYISASSDKGDYDVISFNSIIKNGEYNTGDKYLVNAALNIETKDLTVLGIDKIELSRVRDVYLFPKDGLLIIKKNRDFVFDGQVFTGNGRFNLFGKDFYFDYEDFRLDLNYIDSVQLSVPLNPLRKDMYGNELLTNVKTVIEAVKGDLRIDHHNNKSGIRKDSFPEFPIFRSFEDSYAYYDKTSTFNGIYDRNKFSFHLEPFEIDSLDNYTGKGLWFAGTFQSSDIFPVFKDTLRIQSDYSLGFKRKTPDSGFEIYNGKAKYYNDIFLSDKGLLGSGQLDYLSSRSISKEIYFFPDSSNLNTDSFNIKEVVNGVEFPDVINSKTYVHFEPYNDFLNVFKLNHRFEFYNSNALFNGDLIIRPNGLTGGGIMNIDNAKINSNLFTYNAKWFDSDTTSLEVFEDSGNLAFSATNLKSHIDVDSKIGSFLSNGVNSFVIFPANQYVCFIDKLNWDIKEKHLILGDEVYTDGGSKFVSIHPKQDSLSFLAKTAFYSLNNYIINARGVDFIDIADAIIYPDSGLINVNKNAMIETLYNSKIVVDNLTEYHTFNNSTIDIKSQNNYIASGDYVYNDHLDNKKDLFFNDIKVNADTVTIASSVVDNNQNFNLNENFNFKGSINLISDQRELIFDGFFKINHNCNHIKKEWVKFKSPINPKDIKFILNDNVFNDKEDLLSTAIVMSFDSLNFYNTFLSRKKRTALDFDVLTAKHRLFYDFDNSSYVIGGPDTLSNFYVLNDKTCNVTGEGILDLNLNLGQVELNSVGEITYIDSTNNIEINGFLMIDFFFSDKAMKVMAEDLYSAPGDAFFEYDKNFSKNLGRLVGKEMRDIYLVDLEMTDEYSKFPNQMNNSIVFAKTKLIWNQQLNAYTSIGPISVSNILNKQVNASLEGYIILEKGKKSDLLTIYLQTELYDEYYFEYKNGVMRAWSTNPEFNLEIDDVKESKRSLDKNKGVSLYRYMSAPEDAVEKFLKSIKKKL